MTPDSPCLAKARSFLSALFPRSPPLRSVCASVSVCVCLWIWESHIWCTWCTQLSGKIKHRAGLFTFSICWTERNKANSDYPRAERVNISEPRLKTVLRLEMTTVWIVPFLNHLWRRTFRWIAVSFHSLPSIPHRLAHPETHPWTSRSRRLPHMSTTNLLLWSGSFPLSAIFHFNSTSLLRQLVLEPKLSRAAGTFGLPAFCRQHSVASWITSYGVGIGQIRRLRRFFLISSFFFLNRYTPQGDGCGKQTTAAETIWEMILETYFASFTS